MSTITKYVMTGNVPGTGESVFWSVYNSPDFLGAFSGYGSGVLLNVAISYQESVPASSATATANPIGPAGGDLSGTYPDPTVAQVQGVPFSATTPTSGQLLGFNGTSWAPTALGGDVTGAAASNTVAKLRGTPVSSTSPSTNQIMGYLNTNWQPIYWNTVNIMNYGADPTGSVDSTAAFNAAHNALPSIGGTIIVPDGGNFLVSNVTFTKPIRLVVGRASITGTGTGNMFNVNVNFVVEGQDQYESNFFIPSGQVGIGFNGSWSFGPGQLAQQIFIIKNIGFQGGATALTTQGITSFFSQGYYLVSGCRFYETSSFAVYIGSEISFTYMDRCQFDTCNGSLTIYDNTETKCRECLHYPANGATNPNILITNGHRVYLDTNIFESARNRYAPDIHIAVNDTFNQNAGYIKVIDCHFAPEAEYSWSSQRVRILNDSSAYNSVNSAGNVEITGNYFYVGSAPILAGTGTPSITTTGSLPNKTATIHLSLTSGQNDCGVQVGDKFYLMQSLDPDGYGSFNGGPFTCTGRTATSVSWTTQSTFSTGTTGYIMPGSVAAIRLASTCQDWLIDDNYFLGYPICVDDGYIQGDTIGEGATGRCVFGSGNRVYGMLGQGVTTFTQGGVNFDTVKLPPASSSLERNGVARNNETLGLMNRCYHSETVNGVIGMILTTGLTDPFGGTRAFSLQRDGYVASSVGVGDFVPPGGGGAEIAAIEIDEGAIYPLPTNPALSYLTFWAKMGGPNPTTVLTLTLYQASIAPVNTIFWTQNISLSPNWKHYQCPIVWPKGLPNGTNDLFISCGTVWAEPTSVELFGFCLSDYQPQDYIPTFGSPVFDGYSGNRFQKCLSFDPALSAATATAGAASLPAAPVGFIEITISGTVYKVPYYNV